MNVQTHIQKRLEREGQSFESVTCPACTRLHFIDLTTGHPVSRDR